MANYLDLDGLKEYHENVSALIDEHTFSKDYNDLLNRPDIKLNARVEGENLLLNVSGSIGDDTSDPEAPGNFIDDLFGEGF